MAAIASNGGVSSLRYGIVGSGMMGVEHIRNLVALQDPGVRITAIVDPHKPSQDAGLAAAADAGWKDVEVFPDINSLLAKDVCDVLVVSTPNMTHSSILQEILADKRPLHVLVEKPLCTTVTDCRQVIASASTRASPAILQVGLEYRYMPPVARLISHVKAGAIGRVRMVAIREHRFPFLVKVNNWNRFNANSGGTLVEKCCHFFDLMSLIVGAKPRRVMASGAQDVNHLDEVYDGKVSDIIDNAFVIVEYEGGARGCLDLCMFAEGSRNEQEISVVGDQGKIEALVPEGIVRVGPRKTGRAGVTTEECHDERIKYDGLHHGSSYLEHLELLAAIRAGSTKLEAAGLQEGLMSVAIGVAAQQSIAEGRPVLLEEVLNGSDQ